MHNFIRNFLRYESAGGILLILSSIFAIVLSNTSLEQFYNAFLMTPVTVGVSTLVIHKPLILWINDGLMAIFFLLIGLEVKRELIEGSLATKEQAIFPAIAAVGGMIAPALIYVAFNLSDAVALTGWAIPAATDIAFALGIMALLGNRVPLSLKIFLLALAIIDDLGVISVIAIFYSADLSVTALIVASIALIALITLNYKGSNNLKYYAVFGLILWVSVLKSGVHATLAGVLIGFIIPLNKGSEHSPLKDLEHKLHPYVAFIILPLFAFANAGVSLNGVTLTGLFDNLPMGIICGLIIGKPLGISLICYLAIKFKIAKLPPGVNFKQIVAVSILCGIGFTMSMFISSLAFEHAALDFMSYSRLAILIGSTMAAVCGYFTLKMALPKRKLSN